MLTYIPPTQSVTVYKKCKITFFQKNSSFHFSSGVMLYSLQVHCDIYFPPGENNISTQETLFTFLLSLNGEQSSEEEHLFI